MNNLEKQKYQIHYYFDDKSHSMNAFVRNKAEKDKQTIRHISNFYTKIIYLILIEK